MAMNRRGFLGMLGALVPAFIARPKLQVQTFPSELKNAFTVTSATHTTTVAGVMKSARAASSYSETVINCRCIACQVGNDLVWGLVKQEERAIMEDGL